MVARNAFKSLEMMQYQNADEWIRRLLQNLETIHLSINAAEAT